MITVVEHEARLQDEEDKEMDHDTTFKFYCKYLRHTLQLVVDKFSEVRSSQWMIE